MLPLTATVNGGMVASKDRISVHKPARRQPVQTIIIVPPAHLPRPTGVARPCRSHPHHERSEF